jgi:protein tyrosine/serine phosphatase
MLMDLCEINGFVILNTWLTGLRAHCTHKITRTSIATSVLYVVLVQRRFRKSAKDVLTLQDRTTKFENYSSGLLRSVYW